MANISIKFLRSKNVLGSYTLAVEKLKSLNLAYGQPAVVKYYDGSEEDANIRLLLGVGYQQGSDNAVLEVASFESIQKVKDAVTALETTVGDSTKGLVKDVTDIKDTLGSEDSGLAKDVADNKAAIGVINGTGAGSISRAISDLKTEVLGGATSEYDTLGEVEAKIKGLQTNLDTLDESAVKTITGAGIASASKGDAGEWTVTVNSEIDNSADGATVDNKTYSAKKITTLINELKVKDAANGSGTTVSKNESGVLTVNVLTDNDSVKIGDDGKLTVNIVDGGSF